MSAAILVEVARIRDRQPVKAPMAISYRDDGKALPTLTIMTTWQPRKQEYRDHTRYVVEEIPAPDGRGWLLHRDPAVVEAEGVDADTFYGVLIAQNDQDHTCTCRGFQAHTRCKHFDSIRSLIDAGHLDHPLAGSPAPPVSNDDEAPF